jgi:hypothetical protein
VEPSLGKSLDSFRVLGDLHQDAKVMRRNTASRLVRRICLECGTLYGDAVECFFASQALIPGVLTGGIEGRVYDKTISPLLRE